MSAKQAVTVYGTGRIKIVVFVDATLTGDERHDAAITEANDRVDREWSVQRVTWIDPTIDKDVG